MEKQVEIPIKDFLRFVKNLLLNCNFPLDVFVGEGGGGFKEYKEVMMGKESVTDEEWGNFLKDSSPFIITDEVEYEMRSLILAPTLEDIKNSIPSIVEKSESLDDFISHIIEGLNEYGVIGNRYNLTESVSYFINLVKSYEEKPYTSTISQFFENHHLVNTYITNREIISKFCTKWSRIEKLTEILN